MSRVSTSICKKKKKHNYLWGIFGISFLLHLLPVIIVGAPTSGPDEVISLSSAAKLAGYDWSFLVTRFQTWYGCGSAWFFAPLFRIISNGIVVYNFARVFLTFLLSMQTVVCYKILKEILECDNELEVCIVSLCGSFFSNVTADIFCNEAVLTLSTWLYIYFMLKIYRGENRLKNSLSVMIIFAYCMISHSRAIIYAPSILLIAIMISIRKRKSFFDLRAVGFGGVLIFAASKVNNIVKATLYNNLEAIEEIKELTDGQVNSSRGLVHNFFLTINEYGVIETIEGILRATITNIYALMVFTGFGASVACVCAICVIAQRKKKEKDCLVSIISGFCIIGLVLSILAMGVIHCWHGIYLETGNVFNDGRFFFYLRYYINFLPPMVIPMYMYMREKNKKKMMLGALILSFVIYLAFDLLFYRTIIENRIEEFDVGKLFEAFSFGNVVSYAVAFKICLLVNIVLVLICCKSNRVNLYFGFLFCLIFYQQMYQCIFFRKPIADVTRTYTDKIVELSDEEQLRNYFEDVGRIYVCSNKTYKLEYYVQLVMPEIDIRKFEKKHKEDYTKKIVFSNESLTSVGGNKIYRIRLDENEALYTNSYKYYLDLKEIIE